MFSISDVLILGIVSFCVGVFVANEAFAFRQRLIGKRRKAKNPPRSTPPS